MQTPFALNPLRLEAQVRAQGEETAYRPSPGKRTSPAGRLNMAGVLALSRRLMARERARALGRKPLDLRTYALEQEARRWTETKASRN